MSGVKPPAGVPETAPSREPEWAEFNKRIITRKPNYEEVHLKSDGVTYFGDSGTNGSWRITRSGDNLVFQRLESGTWTTKDTITP